MVASRVVVSALLVLCLALAGSVGPGTPSAGATVTPAATAGTDFWLAFGSNAVGSPPFALWLYLTGADATSGTVTMPDGTGTPFTVTPGTVTRLQVSSALAATLADGVVDAGIRVTAAKPVVVYGLNTLATSSDGFTALPTPTLGTRYRAVAGVTNDLPCASRILVVGTQDGTTVTVTPAGTIGARAAGVPYTVALQEGEVYTVAATSTAAGANDVTGSLVTSDKPVAVHAGADCGLIGTGGGSDHQMEQLTPTSTWGTEFVAVRFAKDSGGDPVRIVADTDGTQVRVDGVLAATLQAGQVFTGTVLTAGGNTGAVLTTSAPALVAQFATRGAYTQWGSAAQGDPAMTLLPPAAQYLASYTLSTPYTRYGLNLLNLSVPAGAVDSVRLDGAALPGGTFAPVGTGGYASAQVLLSGSTSHTVRADARFGAVVYGSNSVTSYAYPGGAGLTPVGTVAAVTVDHGSQDVAPGDSACVTATVAAAGGAPVPGVYVGFRVAGANPSAGEVPSDSDGTARFCAAGLAAGTDTVTMTAGRASTTATVVRTAPPAPSPTPTPTTPAPTGPSPASPSPVGPSPEATATAPATPSTPNTPPDPGPPPDPGTPPLPASPTVSPSASPTVSPSATPTVSSSASPTVPPSATPTVPPVSPTAPPPGAARPDAPGRTRAVAGDQAVAAGWAAAVPHGAAVTGYTATATPGGGACTAPAAATTCVIGNLTNGTTYRVSVVAHSAAGDSPAAVTATTPTHLLGGAAGLVVERRGRTLTLVLTGYRPRSTVVFSLHSTPTRLGTAITGTDGRATARIRLPAGLRGHHTVTADGLAPSGHPLSRGWALGPALPSTGTDVLRLVAIGLLLFVLGVVLRLRHSDRNRWPK